MKTFRECVEQQVGYPLTESDVNMPFAKMVEQAAEVYADQFKTKWHPASGIELIAKERQEQIEKWGDTPAHDSQHEKGELANAASLYAMTTEMREFIDNEWGKGQWLNLWPFELNSLKFTPENCVHQLQKAGAFIAAEIDRLNYETEYESQKQQLQPDQLAASEHGYTTPIDRVANKMDCEDWEQFCG